MNLCVGGEGGFSSKEHMIKCSKAGAKHTNNKMWVEERDKHINRIRKQAIEKWKDESYRKKIIKNLDQTGRKHSEETKKKMSESSKGMGRGENNSQYGTCWITNGKENKKINKTDIIPKGWKRGRTLK